MKYQTNNPRELAVRTLLRTSGGSYSNLQINAVIESTSMSDVDKALFTNIVYGVIQHRMTLEYQLVPFLKDPEKTEDWVKELLYTAMYQLEYLDRVPKRAIFDESIKIAKSMGHDGTRRFVTGILHQMDRKGVREPDKIKDPVKKISIKYSVPEWLVSLIEGQLGKQKADQVFKSLNQTPKQSVRFNKAKTTKSKLTDQLTQAGFQTEDSLVAGEGIIVDKGQVVHSAFFENGLLTIQDESAMLPVESMSIQPDDLILDACSAPGGKTTQIAANLKNGRVIALDIHQNKLKNVIRNAKRLGVDGVVETQALDARKVDEKFSDEMFDHILVDAPCSGFGLMRRKPEIRYDKTLADINHLSQIQLQILEAVAPKVKTGGTITYSTCTIVQQENQEVIKQFLDAHPDFQIEPTKTDLNLTTDENGMINIYPDDFGSDGFFVCSLVRKS
ncbi:16S rRNA (cytosine(967)-C(5))-methyltransferase RsmB [Lentilactobacillus hilgardii]|uniref:16S rRNA (cytosine(967)-C(5))-methyltransferase RsmB n=1 Tax=Lentilactobacillus hilgardii TaxID=1588 RepID=UPI00019C602B|nr:16S rRNA (cytosine(967)-C(5))-methyltransferase RsmB [Lentilactobacillus hilgardii]EEI18660.1 ribosomal RNA small subunit methyltransferase B [Lentilactobacillus buchneri ATCC 11577]MCP9332078.1 16S rRNA (cytosine(967)-C(5))-methyltransferase RsmB [Lentilactobacillus hilgardii]MCP9348645.1 16S rRNA (cytosine(967)-C(5))-methyltransferase RsmB [Lentilactobacillus hilgardii]MCP9351527.1 16S rRNA (cytosine(967)-C(5))-methyltransferase RsmB [Lentilactobacillus hilgardii]MCT3397406.1 16S rRNA (cy